MTDAHSAVQIGCGERGQTHARALADSDHFEFVAVCDLDEERARETADEFRVPAVYTDLHEALETENPTHVSLVTPATVRLSVIEDVLAHEPNSLLFEKPVATTYQEVQAVADRVESSDTRVTVCHQHVYGDEIQALGEWIDDGNLGDVERLIGSTKGGLFEHGTHFVHTVDWLLDATPESVRAHAEWGDHVFDDWHAEVEPTDALLKLSYPGNRRAMLHLGPDAPDEPSQADTFWLEYRLDVIGSDGHGQFVLGDHASARFGDDGRERVDVEGFDPHGRSTRELYDVLADCLAGERDDHPSDFESALATHRVVEAALRSAEEARAVELDELK